MREARRRTIRQLLQAIRAQVSPWRERAARHLETAGPVLRRARLRAERILTRPLWLRGRRQPGPLGIRLGRLLDRMTSGRMLWVTAAGSATLIILAVLLLVQLPDRHYNREGLRSRIFCIRAPRPRSVVPQELAPQEPAKPRVHGIPIPDPTPDDPEPLQENLSARVDRLEAEPELVFDAMMAQPVFPPPPQPETLREASREQDDRSRVLGALHAAVDPTKARLPAEAEAGLHGTARPFEQDPQQTHQGASARIAGERPWSSGPDPCSVVPTTATTPAGRFLAERCATEGLRFLEPRGYWFNTYVPGDPDLRLLQARLLDWDMRDISPAGSGQYRLHTAVRSVQQPLDASAGAAISVFIQADRRGLSGPGRLLAQVGLQGAPRFSGQRPAMRVGVVLDLRSQPDSAAAAGMRALVLAFAEARDIADEISLTVAGWPDSASVPAQRFRYGWLLVAMDTLLEPPSEPPVERLGLVAAVQRAAATVAVSDDPTAPLGSSIVLLVTAGDLGSELPQLLDLAHTNAVDGIPLSVVGIGDGTRPEQLDRLALAGQGNRRLLASAAAAQDLVDRELAAAGRVIARAVRLRIRLKPGVQLVDVVGSHRLDAESSQRVREAEQSIDQRLARQLGITADRGEDEEGIQIVIPGFYSGDSHVVLLDLVASGPGAIAEVTVRYKDLVHLRNGVSRAQLSLGRNDAPPGPLQRNVLVNLLAYRLGESLRRSAHELRAGSEDRALQILQEQRSLLSGLLELQPELGTEPSLRADLSLLDEYLAVLQGGSMANELRRRLADSLGYAGRRKLLPENLAHSRIM